MEENNKEENLDSMFSASDNMEDDFDINPLGTPEETGEAKEIENNKIPDTTNQETKEEAEEKEVSGEKIREELTENSLQNATEEKCTEDSFEEENKKEISRNHIENLVETVDIGIVNTLDTDNRNTDELVTVRPVKFKEFENTPPVRTIKKNYDILQDIDLHVSVELGKTKSTIKDVMDLAEGSIIELNKIAGEQVEVYVNDKIVARGEVIVIEDRFGVRITSTNLQTNNPNL